MRLGTEQHHGQVLKEDAHCQRRDQCRHRPGLAHGAVGERFHQHAHDRADSDGDNDRQPGRHTCVDHQRNRVEQRVCANHDKITMREVDHTDDAIDHCVAKGNQCVNRALVQSIDQALEKQ